MAIEESFPWLIDDIDERIQTSLGIDHLSSLKIEKLNCKSIVANEFLDLLSRYDLDDQSLNKLILLEFSKLCEPFEEEVVSRLANICPSLTHLEISSMRNLTEAGQMSIESLFRQIIQHNPPIQVLNMQGFSDNLN